MATLSLVYDMVYEQEMSSMVRHESSVLALLQLYQGWLTWGDDDATGPAILHRLSEITAGNAAAIATLQQAAKGTNPQIRAIAGTCLRHLALNGDERAQQAWEDVQP